jgi:hypothetical protein
MMGFSLPDKQHSNLSILTELILLTSGVREADGTTDSVTHVDLTADVVFPGRGIGIWTERNKKNRDG